jgi:hypothetical protein
MADKIPRAGRLPAVLAYFGHEAVLHKAAGRTRRQSRRNSGTEVFYTRHPRLMARFFSGQFHFEIALAAKELSAAARCGGVSAIYLRC